MVLFVLFLFYVDTIFHCKNIVMHTNSRIATVIVLFLMIYVYYRIVSYIVKQQHHCNLQNSHSELEWLLWC